MTTQGTSSTDKIVQELQKELSNTKELLQKLLQTPPGASVDQAAIHALLRRPATFEIDGAASASGSKQRPPTKPEKFGLVSEDGMKALFGGGKPVAPAAEAQAPREPNPSQAPANQATHEQPPNVPPEAAKKQDVEELPTHNEIADAEAAKRAEEEAEAELANKKEAHNQYMRFFRQVRVLAI